MMSRMFGGSSIGYFPKTAITLLVSVTACRARQVVSEATFEVVLVDLSLPDEDGVELIRQMRLDHPHLKILATSGFLVGNMPEIVIAAGATATLRKPTVPRKLRDAVKCLLEPSIRQSGSQPSPLSAAGT
jgi:DNA-binding NarL/FixJ family response regulator